MSEVDRKHYWFYELNVSGRICYVRQIRCDCVCREFAPRTVPLLENNASVADPASTF